jgi:hypothetical protein
VKSAKLVVQRHEQQKKSSLVTAQGAKNGKKLVIQRHHVRYEPEVVVFVTKAEHKILTLCSWYTKKIISVGFLDALTDIILSRQNDAVDLEPEYERRKECRTKSKK